MSRRWAWYVQILWPCTLTWMLASVTWPRNMPGGIMGALATLFVLAVSLANLLLQGSEPPLAPPEPSHWVKLALTLATDLNACAWLWLLTLALADWLGADAAVWQSAVPLYLSGVMAVRALIGPQRRAEPTVLRQRGLVLLGAALLRPKEWLADADVLREARAFSRGLHLGAGLLLGVCGALQVGLWPSVAATFFIHVAEDAHCFFLYRRSLRLTAASVALTHAA